MKKVGLLVLFLILSISFIFATGSKETTEVGAAGGKTKISILRPGDEEKVAEFMEPAIQKFEALNPDIEVEIVYESWGGWIQKYPTLFQANTQPDVIFWWDNKQNDLSAKSKLVDLKPYSTKRSSMLFLMPSGTWPLLILTRFIMSHQLSIFLCSCIIKMYSKEQDWIPRIHLEHGMSSC